MAYGQTYGNHEKAIAEAVCDRLVELNLGGGEGSSGSIDNIVGAAQNGAWNITNITGTITLPTGAATALKQPALGTAGSSSNDVLSVQGILGGTPLNVSQISSAAVVSPTFSGSATSSTFAIANRLANGVIPAIAGAPTLTLEYTLDGGTTWAKSSSSFVTSASNATPIETDSFAKVGGVLGLANAFRFTSSASITAATITIRSVVQ